MSLHPKKTLILSGDDVQHIVQHFGIDTIMDSLISRLLRAFQSFDPKHTVIPARSGFHYEHPHAGLIEWMPLLNQGEQVVIKVVGYHPANPVSFDLPTIVSTISTYNTTTGHLTGLIDGVLLTALRTGAASAVASQFMAHPDSSTLGLIGCGAQAITQLHAISRVFNLKKVLINDIDTRTMLSFADRCESLELKVDFVPASISDIVKESEILCTATSIDVGAGPLFTTFDTYPALHINAVGSDFPGKTELPAALLKNSFVCPDFTEQALQEGECQQLDKTEVGPDITEVVQSLTAYAHVKNQRTVFDSTGWALEDQVAVKLFLEYASELGLGRKIEIENMQDDAKNPYHFLKKVAAMKP